MSQWKSDTGNWHNWREAESGGASVTATPSRGLGGALLRQSTGVYNPPPAGTPSMNAAQFTYNPTQGNVGSGSGSAQHTPRDGAGMRRNVSFPSSSFDSARVGPTGVPHGAGAQQGQQPPGFFGTMASRPHKGGKRHPQQTEQQQPVDGSYPGGVGQQQPPQAVPGQGAEGAPRSALDDLSSEAFLAADVLGPSSAVVERIRLSGQDPTRHAQIQSQAQAALSTRGGASASAGGVTSKRKPLKEHQRWVTIFGVEPYDVMDVLVRLEYNFGRVRRHIWAGGRNCNWAYVMFESPFDAARAVYAQKMMLETKDVTVGILWCHEQELVGQDYVPPSELQTGSSSEPGGIGKLDRERKQLQHMQKLAVSGNRTILEVCPRSWFRTLFSSSGLSGTTATMCWGMPFWLTYDFVCSLCLVLLLSYWLLL